MQKGAQPTTNTFLSEEILRFRDLTFVEEMSADRYARQRLIPGWDQKKIAAARVLVAGAGALGNEAIKNLALLGVGRILIVDFDFVEVSNLSRCVLFREDDIGKSKALAAARAVTALNPDVEVAALEGDIGCDLGEGELREYDLVLGCLDSIAARWALNRLCRSARVPWLNAGISTTMGQVSLHDPHLGTCYECSMTRSMWHRMNQRRSCLMVGNPMRQDATPATAILASITAALQVQQAVDWLHRDTANAQPGLQPGLEPGQMLVVNTQMQEMTVVPLTMNPTCAAHGMDADATSAPIQISASPETLTVEEMLAIVPQATSWILEFDIVTELECAACGVETVLLPLRHLRLPSLTCPQCGSLRVPRLTQEVQRTTPLARATLQQFGVPHQAMLKIRTGQGMQRVELLQPRPAKLISKKTSF